MWSQVNLAMARSPSFVAVLEIVMLASGRRLRRASALECLTRQELPAAALLYPDLQHANFGRRAFSAGRATIFVAVLKPALWQPRK
jgi:hypothetical protein